MGNALIPHVDSTLSLLDALFRVNPCPPYSEMVIARPINCNYLYLYKTAVRCCGAPLGALRHWNARPLDLYYGRHTIKISTHKGYGRVMYIHCNYIEII